MDLEPLDSHNKSLLERVHPSDWKTKPRPGGYDFVAIGGGTAALVATGGAAMLGARVALIEKEFMGGDCLMSGCVPSKSLLHAAKLAHQTRLAGESGIQTGEVSVDFAKVMETLRSTRSNISHDDAAEAVAARGIDVLFGHARFVSPTTLELNGETISFKRAIICTGSRPRMPDIPGLAEADPLTNETLFNLTELPRRIAVLGGGPIGCEMAQALGRLGAEVTVLNRSPQLLPKDDPAAGEVVRQAFERDGIAVWSEAELQRVELTEQGQKLAVRVGDESRPLAVDRIFVAIGRIPNVESLALEAAGVDYDEKGVAIDDYQQTSNKRIYAAGDVANKLKFTHSAYAYAEYATMNALAPLKLFKAAKRVIPWCTYVDPEVAHVGLSYQELMEREGDWDCYMAEVSENDRAKVELQTDGFVKLYTKRRKGKLIAATVVGANAGELISELSLAITAGKGLDAIGSTVHPYPTRSESIRKAADQYMFGKITTTVQKLAQFWFKRMR